MHAVTLILTLSVRKWMILSRIALQNNYCFQKSIIHSRTMMPHNKTTLKKARSTGADEAGVQNVFDNRERRSGNNKPNIWKQENVVCWWIHNGVNAKFCLKNWTARTFTRTFVQGPGQGQGLECQGPGLFLKDQDKDKDFIFVLKESLRTRTRTRTNITGIRNDVLGLAKIYQ